MSDRATCWSVTINNPGKNDEEFIAAARQKGWKVDGQLEKGENGTPHYQLIVRTPQVRFSAVKKAFPRAHIEIARNPEALASYVKKSETREGELPKTESKYPTQSAYFKMVTEELYAVDKDLRIDFTCAQWYRSRKVDQEQRLLDALDEATSILIRRGYHVETLAVNPQTRSAWKKFGMDIIHRSQAEMSADRQTDRQTGFISLAEDITDGEERNDTESSSGGQDPEEDSEEQADYGPDDSPDEECSEGDESSEAGESDYQSVGGDEVCSGDDS